MQMDTRKKVLQFTTMTLAIALQFYSFLRRLLNARFEKRIMFGSDEMVWPYEVSTGINSIGSAPFFTPEQKRDILYNIYNNATRFLRVNR